MPTRRRQWYQLLANHRRNPNYPVLIAGHCLLDKMIPLNIHEDSVEAAVRHGALVPDKCERPDKLAFRRVEGPTARRPLVVITRFRETHVKVVTVYIEE